MCQLASRSVSATDHAQAFPALAQGAFSPANGCRSPFNPVPAATGGGGDFASCTYTVAELAELVRYAKDRAVRVVPELDTPSHSASWCIGYPEICISCNVSHLGNKTSIGVFDNGCPVPPDSRRPAVGPQSRGARQARLEQVSAHHQQEHHQYPGECRYGYFNNLDPSHNKTWEVLGGLFGELSSVFEDSYLHLGFDEIRYDCYDRPHVNAWMETVGIGPGDYKVITLIFKCKAAELGMTCAGSTLPPPPCDADRPGPRPGGGAVVSAEGAGDRAGCRQDGGGLAGGLRSLWRQRVPTGHRRPEGAWHGHTGPPLPPPSFLLPHTHQQQQQQQHTHVHRAPRTAHARRLTPDPLRPGAHLVFARMV